MKITIILDRIASDLAGTENQVVKLINGLGIRHELELIALKRTPWLSSAHLPCKVSVFEIGGITKPQFFVRVLSLIRHLAATRPDVVHTFFPISNIVGVLAARIAGVQAIVGSRRDYGHWITPGYLRATKFANRFLNGIVTNSPQVKIFTNEVENFPLDRIAVIYNGVNLDHLRRKSPSLILKQKLGIPPENKVVTLVANFRPIKRHDTLLEAARLLIDRHPNISLLFVGADNAGEPALDSVLKLAEQLGIRDRVFVSQANGNIVDYLSISDIGVNCSESEGLSNAVIEYMACGVPCIVSNGGGNRDLVQHGRTGLAFPVGNHIALCEQITMLLEDAELRTRCADAALDMVCQEMNLVTIITKFENYYLKLSGKNKES